MKKIFAFVIAMSLATPAFSQLAPNLAGRDTKIKTDVEVREQEERENAFKSGLGKIPDGKATVDPWGNVRAAPPAKQKQQREGSK